MMVVSTLSWTINLYFELVGESETVIVSAMRFEAILQFLKVMRMHKHFEFVQALNFSAAAA